MQVAIIIFVPKKKLIQRWKQENHHVEYLTALRANKF
jgi:hypothetical protein